MQGLPIVDFFPIAMYHIFPIVLIVTESENDVSSIEEKLRKTGLYNTDNSEASRSGRSSRIGRDSGEACTNSPDENREICQLAPGTQIPSY